MTTTTMTQTNSVTEALGWVAYRAQQMRDSEDRITRTANHGMRMVLRQWFNEAAQAARTAGATDDQIKQAAGQ